MIRFGASDSSDVAVLVAPAVSGLALSDFVEADFTEADLVAADAVDFVAAFDLDSEFF